ncbi:hypothetical protein O6H91_07G053600 [Diphasiastrum complanatum]|uniref:Uncharacterized protein n=1 Tax=Diphasiastrum complanatum TaxID=34168 RepID=A0ACC2D677_DIPCM|nr:hypothetical protein O6H91_07G053600 [Diphasiastrum complanatum]
MAGQSTPYKPRMPMHPKKQKRKDAPSSEKHDVGLAEQMDDAREIQAKKRKGKSRNRQESEEYVEASMSTKILKEAHKQQLEIEEERDEMDGSASRRKAFSALSSDLRADSDEDEGEDDVDLLDNTSTFGEFEEISEEEEKIMSMFMAKEAGPQHTLTDLIMELIRKQDVASVPHDDQGKERAIPGVENNVMEVYRGVGKLLSRYSAGKLPKAFKIVPALSNWEEILYLTEPENWSPHGVYQATRLFASNLNARMAQRFYNLVLLPRVREDIRAHKRLHFALYQALKKSVYKPSAFYKGILLPLCQSRTCNLREAVIIGSVIQKVSLPVLHSSVALLKIAEMEYCGTNSYFMKLLLDKKYALPYRVLDSLVGHFVRFIEDDRSLPVIWHQCLLTFVQRYKNEFRVEDKDNLQRVMRQHRHYLVTPEIQRELQHSLLRGQKEDVSMSLDIHSSRLRFLRFSFFEGS